MAKSNRVTVIIEQGNHATVARYDVENNRLVDGDNGKVISSFAPKSYHRWSYLLEQIADDIAKHKIV